jgi:hypothetical protein
VLRPKAESTSHYVALVNQLHMSVLDLSRLGAYYDVDFPPMETILETQVIEKSASPGFVWKGDTRKYHDIKGTILGCSILYFCSNPSKFVTSKQPNLRAQILHKAPPVLSKTEISFQCMMTSAELGHQISP